LLLVACGTVTEQKMRRHGHHPTSECKTHSPQVSIRHNSFAFISDQVEHFTVNIAHEPGMLFATNACDNEHEKGNSVFITQLLARNNYKARCIGNPLL